MAGCDNCFFGGVKIGNKGPEDSPLVIVGESPGVMEIHYREPFRGDVGKALHMTLEQQGLGDIQPFFTNAISCLPRRKDPEKLAAACAACNPRLIQEIKKHPRKVILALGNGAMWSLLGNTNLKITKERGKLFRSELASIGIVTAVHPSFLLRGGGNFVQFQRDIKYAIDLVREGENALKTPDGATYRILETELDAYRFEEELADQKAGTEIASDIETTGFNHITDRILEVGFQYQKDKITIVPYPLLKQGHFNPKLQWCWHNGKFDTRFLIAKGFEDAKVDDDTMLLSYSLNEKRGVHDLDQAASDWLGSANHKDIVSEYYKGFVIDAITGLKRRRNLSDCPIDIRYRYLALDMADTYGLLKKLKPMVLADPNLTKFYLKHLLPATPYLRDVELEGMLVDQEWVRSNTERLQKIMVESEMALDDYAVESGFGHLNIRSPVQLRNFLYGHLKLAPVSWGTDKDTMEELAGMHPNHPALMPIKNYRKSAKSFTTYVRPLYPPGTYVYRNSQGKEKVADSFLYPDGRVHQTYLIHGTATSRLSCANPNMQNVPRDPLLRGMFIPPAGYGIIEVDYSQAELRSLACLSGCPDLMGIFLRGEDLHNELSKFLFGANFTREDKMKAKTVNFGIVYGRTAPSIADAFDVSIAEAQSWIDGWFRRFPKAAEFITKCRMAPILEQTITTCFGNKKRPGLVGRDKLKDVQNESANFPHQSIASNLTVRAGIELRPILKKTYDTHVVNTVHDCIVAYVPLEADTIKAVAELMIARMQEIPLRYKGLGKVPFKAEPEFGLRWGNLLKWKQMEEGIPELNIPPIGWDLAKVPTYVPAH